MTGVQVQPRESNVPFYAKLIAQVDNLLLSSGDGKLYLGFHLDPLYAVHWDNTHSPVRYELNLPTGIRANPASGQGPRVSARADTDPREFLVDLEGANKNAVIGVTVNYYASNKTRKQQRLVSQSYYVTLKADPDAGVLYRGARQYRRGELVRMIMQNDRDGNGRVSSAEMPEFARRMAMKFDSDGDGEIDLGEATRIEEQVRKEQGSR